MPTLLEKIEANAAARLAPVDHRTGPPELPRYQAFLKVETHRLKLLHRSGGGGLEVCRARAAILDVLFRYLWEAARGTLSDQGRREFPPIALVALGGYGRAELNPHSDIDFMFLHRGQVAGNRPLPYLARMIDGIYYPLLDIGLKIGHSVRSLEDCIRIANTDMQSKTSLIEARWVTGDETLFEKFQKAVVAKCVTGHEEEYIAMRLRDQAARRAKFGNSATMQEPNIKNGCGGLRDFQNLVWMTFFKYRTRSLADLQQRELISGAERKQLETAYDYLLRARTELHYHTNRAGDVLTKAVQPAVAHNLGHHDRSPSVRLEKFMREVYSHMRNIHLLTRTLEQRLALLPQPEAKLSLRKLLAGRARPRGPETVVDGFKCVDGEITALSNRIFRDQPRRLMRVFLYAQQRGLRLHPDLAALIRNNVALVDREFVRDPHVRDTFLEILNQRGNVATILRAMHEVELLGKDLPEFGRLTCLVQHEFYHQYTADEHTLVCLEQLDRVWEAKQPPHRAYAPLLHGLERPFLIYLALLLHDTGKAGENDDHSAAGRLLARRVAKRLDLDAGAALALETVIAHHLLPVRISQRRDLEDAAVIRSFAREVQQPETLSLLTLHSFVDSLATSDKLWNGFKDSLLWTLHHKTMSALTGGQEFQRVEEQHRESLLEEVKPLLSEHLSEEELHAHAANLPARYFLVHTAREIVDDLLLTHRFMRLQLADEEKDPAGALAPVVNWHNHPDRGGNAVKICTWDRSGLFSKITGSLSACGLNILSAQIFTRADGIVLDTFFVTDARTGTLASREQRDRFEELLMHVLTGHDVDLRAQIAKLRGSVRPLYEAYEGERMTTHVAFDNETSETSTVIDVETEDRVGLLYVITQTLAELNLDVSAARIATEKGAAVDSLYVSEIGGEKITDAPRQKSIERKLRHAIAGLE